MAASSPLVPSENDPEFANVSFETAVNDETRLRELEDQHRRFNELFLEKIKSENGMAMFESFYKNVLSIKTDSYLEHAFHNFGKVRRKRSDENILGAQ